MVTGQPAVPPTGGGDTDAIAWRKMSPALGAEEAGIGRGLTMPDRLAATGSTAVASASNWRPSGQGEASGAGEDVAMGKSLATARGERPGELAGAGKGEAVYICVTSVRVWGVGARGGPSTPKRLELEAEVMRAAARAGTFVTTRFSFQIFMLRA